MYGKRFRECDCGSQEPKVKIPMEPFVKEVQPELYEQWRVNEDFAMHPEDPPCIKGCLNDATPKVIHDGMTIKELDTLRANLCKKREIPRWYKERLNVDYDHNEEIVTDPIELRTIDEETNHLVKPRSMVTKRKLIEMTNDESREVRVKFKKIGMDKYIRMKRDERAVK